MRIVLALAGTHASGDTGVPRSGRFTALTYHVHGLPPELVGDDTPARMAEIAPLLDDFNAVGLQEVWRSDYEDTLTAASHRAARIDFTDQLDDGKEYGSGLVVPSDLAPTEVFTEDSTACNGYLDGGGGCFASKGFIVARLPRGEGALYDTHLEAENGDAGARALQVDQLVASLHGRSAGRAVLLLGDMNMDATDPADADLFERLLDEGGLADVCQLLDRPEPDPIDHLLIRDGDRTELAARASANEPAFYDDAGAPLSDHPALSATIEWSTREAARP